MPYQSVIEILLRDQSRTVLTYFQNPLSFRCLGLYKTCLMRLGTIQVLRHHNFDLF